MVDVRTARNGIITDEAYATYPTYDWPEDILLKIKGFRS